MAAWRRKASLRRQLHEPESTSPEQHFYDLAIDFSAYFEVIWNAGEERALSGHHIHARKWLAVLDHVRGFPGWPDLRALDGEQWKEVFGARQYPLDGSDVDLRLFGWSFPIHLNKLLGSKHRAALLRGLSGLAGDHSVTRARWRAFTTPYQKIFSATALTTATRMLTVIRPDRFAPANAGCIQGLSQATGISIGSLDDYWDAHQVIWSWPWARSSEPKRGKNKRRVWDARVALLDVLFYEP